MTGCSRKLATLLAAALLGNAMPLLAREAVPFAPLPSSSAPPGEIEARFMGITTTLFSNGADQLLIDGFFSRPHALRMLFGIRPNRAAIDYAFARAGIDRRLRAVLVAHSHHDHALDSAAVAARTGAILVGSASTGNIGLGGGLPRTQIDVVADDAERPFGGFDVRFFVSPHARPFLFPGEISEPLTPPARLSRYKEGGNFSFLIRGGGLSVLVHPGAHFIAGRYGEARVKADIVFLSIGSLGQADEDFAQDYWREVVLATCARLVILTHWDDFTRRLEHGLAPMPVPADRIRRAGRWIGTMAERDGVEVRTMTLFEPVNLNRVLPPAAAIRGEPRPEHCT